MITRHLRSALQHPQRDAIVQSAFQRELLKALPAGYQPRELTEADIPSIQVLQEATERNSPHPLRVNDAEELLKSLSFGVWVGVFTPNGHLCAYTALELQNIREYILLYFKVTLNSQGHLKGFQLPAFRLRKTIGEKLLAASPFPCMGGYVTVSPVHQQSRKTILQAGFRPLFSSLSLYGNSPHGDRELYGYGALNGLLAHLPLKVLSSAS